VTGVTEKPVTQSHDSHTKTPSKNSGSGDGDVKLHAAATQFSCFNSKPPGLSCFRGKLTCPDFAKHAPEIGLRRDAHDSMRVVAFYRRGVSMSQIL